MHSQTAMLNVSYVFKRCSLTSFSWQWKTATRIRPVEVSNRKLNWLAEHGYLKETPTDILWKTGDFVKLYDLDWNVVTWN